MHRESVPSDTTTCPLRLQDVPNCGIPADRCGADVHLRSSADPSYARRGQGCEARELTESKPFIRSFVKEIAVAPGAATIRYTIAMPEDSRLRAGKAEEVALGDPVLSTVKFGREWWT